MFGEKTSINSRLILGTLIVFAAALFVMSLSPSANAQPFSYSGKIIAIDHDSKILTVQANPDSQNVFRMDQRATVLKCDKPESFGDLAIGDEVTVRYYENNSGDYFAEGITLAPRMGEKCLSS